MKSSLLDSIQVNIQDALKSDRVGQFVAYGPGYWVYPLGVVIELNSALCSQDDITEVEDCLREELHKNSRTLHLQVVAEHPLEGEAAVIPGTQLSEKQLFNVRRQTFAEVFANELRWEGFLTDAGLVKRVRVKFHNATCEKISGQPVDSSFFQTVLENYSEDHTFYRIEEGTTPIDRGYSLFELEEVPATLPDGVGNLEITPFEIRNSTRTVVHLEIRNLNFSTIKGVALLPDQTLKVVQKLDVDAVKQQIESGRWQTNEDVVCEITLLESEFDLLPRQNIVFTPLSRSFRAKPTTRLFSSEQEKYKLLYVGARMRALRTEIYIADLFDPTFNSPMAIAVGYTQADRARWYAFNQPCELQVSDPTASFRILPGYLFRADCDQFRIRNIHLAFRSSHANRSMNALSDCEILMESSENETLIMVQKPKPVLVAAFSEHDIPDIHLGKDRFQLRIARSSRRISAPTRTGSIQEETARGLKEIRTRVEREAILKVREGQGLSHKPWKSIAFDELFVVGNHLLRVTRN